MATVQEPCSMNRANPLDPHNNSCYGTLVDRDYKTISLPILDVLDFNERVIRGYEEGVAEKDLPADHATARSLVPAGTANLRDFRPLHAELVAPGGDGHAGMVFVPTTVRLTRAATGNLVEALEVPLAQYPGDVANGETWISAELTG